MQRARRTLHLRVAAPDAAGDQEKEKAQAKEEIAEREEELGKSQSCVRRQKNSGINDGTFDRRQVKVRSAGLATKM